MILVVSWENVKDIRVGNRFEKSKTKQIWYVLEGVFGDIVGC